MTKEQKSQLNELLEALKKADKECYVEFHNQGVWTGVESVQYEKGDDYVEYHRNFDYYQQIIGPNKFDSLGNKDIIWCIEESLKKVNYILFFKNMVEGLNFEFKSSDDYDFNNVDLRSYSMDDDEIPEEILDEDGEIDMLKLEDNGWSFERGEQEVESMDIDIAEISISVDDKQFTFKSD